MSKRDCESQTRSIRKVDTDKDGVDLFFNEGTKKYFEFPRAAKPEEIYAERLLSKWGINDPA